MLRAPQTSVNLLTDRNLGPEPCSRKSIAGRSAESQKPIRIMKFGGTSLGDASCIRRVVDIVRAAAPDSHIVVVVSAMSQVTNKLIQAAKLSAIQERQVATAIFDELRARHDAVAKGLIRSAREQNQIISRIEELFREGLRHCEEVRTLRKPIPRLLDSISGLGERLVAPLVTAALAERGIASQAIEATEVIVTNEEHGAADPQMDLTRERCERQLRPLMMQGIIPVITGYIGATPQGVLTTLGRGSSDYSATILASALDADDVIIWTDVDGILTADPQVVPCADCIPEISYEEAGELASYGAKVLHPKTLREVIQSGIPVWIRNTFAPERLGTRITSTGRSHIKGIKALAAKRDVDLIFIEGPSNGSVRSIRDRITRVASAVQADLLAFAPDSIGKGISVAVPSADSEKLVEVLDSEFELELAHGEVNEIRINPDVAIVAMVGQEFGDKSVIALRILKALQRKNAKVIAVAQSTSDCSIQLIVAEKDAEAALRIAHQEFRLGTTNAQESSERCS